MKDFNILRRLRPSAQTDASIKAIVSPAERLDWFDSIAGERIAIRVASGQVSGQCTMLESVAQPGASTPLHAHLEDEIFHVLEGVVTFTCGGDSFDATAGTTVTIPAGAHHAWRNRSEEQSRMLVIFTPGGIETLFAQVAGRSPQELATLAARYGTTVVGPPIDG